MKRALLTAMIAASLATTAAAQDHALVLTGAGRFAIFADVASVTPDGDGVRMRSLQVSEEDMVIGGVAVFDEALPSARRVHLTEVHAAPMGDTVLPPFDPAVWAETTREDHDAAGDTPGYSFVTLERRT